MLIERSLIFPQWDMVGVGYCLRENIAYSSPGYDHPLRVPP